MLHYVWPRPPSRPIDAVSGGVAYKAKVRSVAAVAVLVGFSNKVRLLSVFEKDAPERERSKVKVVRPGVYEVGE